MQTTLGKPRPDGFYAGAKRLAQPAFTLDAFLAKYEIEYEILSFERRPDFPLMVGDHYVVHLKGAHGSTNCWATVPAGTGMTIEKFMAGLQRECEAVAIANEPFFTDRDVLAGYLVDTGLVKYFPHAIKVAYHMRENVGGFEWAFGKEATNELIGASI